MNATTERYLLRDKLAQCLNESGGEWKPNDFGASIGHWRVSLMQFGKTTLTRKYSTRYASFGVDLTFRQLDAMLTELAQPAIIAAAVYVEDIPTPATAAMPINWHDVARVATNLTASVALAALLLLAL